jgi:hypothetical protein
MNVIIGSALAAWLLLATSAHAEGNVFLSYGQSNHLWKVQSDVKDAHNDLFKINTILNDNFGNFETGFARIGGDFVLARPDRSWAKRVRMTVSVEAAALGLVQNPVVPELVAAATAVEMDRVAVEGEPGPGWTYEAALVGGYGLERRLSAVSTDLIESIPFQKGNVRLVGVDLAAAKEWLRTDDRYALRAGWKGTDYFGIDAVTSVALDRHLRSFTHWWEGRADFSRGAFGVHGILGSHPLPVELLPRIWDRVANTNAWRELGAMSGAGVSYSAHRLVVISGLYAGYLGGLLRWNAGKRTFLEISSFGIENSSAYRTLGQRVYAANVTFGL